MCCNTTNEEWGVPWNWIQPRHASAFTIIYKFPCHWEEKVTNMQKSKCVLLQWRERGVQTSLEIWSCLSSALKIARKINRMLFRPIMLLYNTVSFTWMDITSEGHIIDLLIVVIRTDARVKWALCLFHLKMQNGCLSNKPETTLGI